MKITTKKTDYSYADAFMNKKERMFDRKNNKFFGTYAVEFFFIDGIKMWVVAHSKDRWDKKRKSYFFKDGGLVHDDIEKVKEYAS